MLSEMATSATTIDLVRHGEVQTPGLFCATANEPLSETGWHQLTALKHQAEWSAIISSPQKRCREFAAQLAQQQNIPLCVDQAWREMNFGRWTGQRYQSVWDTDAQLLKQLWKTPLDFTAPDGESMRDFIARIQACWEKLLTQHQGKHILVLTHAGAIRALLATVLNIDYQSTQKFAVAHGKINRIRSWPDGEVSLLFWGCSPQSINDN